ncbi:hypothetical protein [Candidatus Methylacidiphilum infernorum]|uniref:Uncharacterized protein n=1 Tax=Methylacidiphilum infernorum (isolate V4) TaxID=481448 RepID=B3DUV6_METI4|nr:hypothetical protein [Candidatus Methylacidiphilum infernorum]ACD83109.1 Hypothetical protein Minf_1054 [Methylacidiphilum infernorum V4]
MSEAQLRPQKEQEKTEKKLPPPVGTLFLLILYLAILAGMWLFMYFEMLQRR